MSIIDTPEGISINQCRYIDTILKKFKMEDAKETTVQLSPTTNFKRLVFPGKMKSTRSVHRGKLSRAFCT